VSQENSGEGSVIEVRPVPPVARPHRALAAVLQKSLLRADPEAGTLLMTEARALTWRRPREWVLALPSTGKADAVAIVCLASYTMHASYREYPMWRMLLLDRHGWVLAAGRARDQAQGRKMWPPELFRPLSQIGIGVSEEQFRNPAELDRAHPTRPA
jgi:hypothetical protein